MAERANEKAAERQRIAEWKKTPQYAELKRETDIHAKQNLIFGLVLLLPFVPLAIIGLIAGIQYALGNPPA